MVVLFVLVAALDAGSPTPPAAPTAGLRDAKAILADYAKAIGDESAWKRHKSVRIKREVVVRAMNFKSQEETRMLRSGKLYSRSSMPGMGTFRRGYDGRVAWSEDPINGLRVLKGAEADDVRLAAVWNSEWRLGKIYSPVKAVVPPDDAPNADSLECVQLAKPQGPPSIVCFDAKTHLRVWEKGVQASQGGQVPYVTQFSDWRTVDGVRVWYHEKVTVGPITMEGHVSRIIFDEPASPRLFSLPRKK